MKKQKLFKIVRGKYDKIWAIRKFILSSAANGKKTTRYNHTDSIKHNPIIQLKLPKNQMCHEEDFSQFNLSIAMHQQQARPGIKQTG